MKQLLLLSLLVSCLIAAGQIETTFESFDAMPMAPLNQAENGYAFISPEGLALYNDYNADWLSWSGWAISADTDNVTPGFLNQYSSIVGAGNNGSSKYATAYAFSPSILSVTDTPSETIFFKGLHITNATYTYLSMRDGDSFAKKFGGVDGTDPDFLFVTVKAYAQGEFVDSIDHYLADYRFDDSSLDYIQNDWEFIDMNNLSENLVDSLTLSLTSSDVGMFGMNTPAYFCIDDVRYDVLGGIDDLDERVITEVGPNPVQDVLNIRAEQSIESIRLMDINGNIMTNVNPKSMEHRLSLTMYPAGIYTILVNYEGHQHIEQVVKL